MGRVIVENFDIPKLLNLDNKKVNDDKNGNNELKNNFETDYSIKYLNNNNNNNNNGDNNTFYISNKRRSISRSSISSIYSSTSTIRPSFSSYTFSLNERPLLSPTTCYTNVFDDEKNDISFNDELLEEQEEEEDDDDNDEDDGDNQFETNTSIYHWDDDEDDDDNDDDGDDFITEENDDSNDNDNDNNIIPQTGGTNTYFFNSISDKKISNKSLKPLIIYRCKKCYADICTSLLIISKDFWGTNGEAYFVKNVLNVQENSKEIMKNMRTGQYGVKDITCIQCDTVIGWKYITSIEPLQRYKINKYVIEKNLLKTYKVQRPIN